MGYSTMRLRDQPISAVIASASNAEDLLEECGIDYWFGCDQTLAAACSAAHVDVAALEERLLASEPIARSEPERKGVSILIEELNSHLDAAIRPAILRIRTAAAYVSDARTSGVLQIVDQIEAMISVHTTLLRRVMPAITRAAAAVTPTGKRTTPEQRVVRDLALQHSLFAVRVKKLVDLCSTLASDGTSESAALARAARQLSKEIHHHIRVSYQAVMPYLFQAASRKPQIVEPW